MKIFNKELTSLCAFSRELNKLGFNLTDEDDFKFVFERPCFNDVVLLYKDLTLVATANYQEVKDAFGLAFDFYTIDDTEIEVSLQDGETFVDLVNRLNTITKSLKNSN